MSVRLWEAERASSLEAMSPQERAEYDRALADAESRLDLAELVYNARVAAGLSQTELARRAGTRQSVISAIEGGGRAPGGVMLARIARAVGARLEMVATA